MRGNGGGWEEEGNEDGGCRRPRALEQAEVMLEEAGGSRRSWNFLPAGQCRLAAKTEMDRWTVYKFVANAS